MQKLAYGKIIYFCSWFCLVNKIAKNNYIVHVQFNSLLLKKLRTVCIKQTSGNIQQFATRPTNVTLHHRSKKLRKIVPYVFRLKLVSVVMFCTQAGVEL